MEQDVHKLDLENSSWLMQTKWNIHGMRVSVDWSIPAIPIQILRPLKCYRVGNYFNGASSFPNWIGKVTMCLSVELRSNQTIGRISRCAHAVLIPTMSSLALSNVEQFPQLPSIVANSSVIKKLVLKLIVPYRVESLNMYRVQLIDSLAWNAATRITISFFVLNKR